VEAETTAQGAFAVALPSFEGPLDLLLSLIQEHKLDVFDIPISFVVDKYLAYMDAARALNIDLAGEYLLMAATLAHIKSRMLLPREQVKPVPAAERGREPPSRFVPAQGAVFLLVAAGFAAYAFVPSGLSAHLLAIFQRNGITPATVVWIGALFGPAQVAARLVEFAFGRNLHPVWIARGALTALIGAFMMLGFTGIGTLTAAAFAILFGGANGLMTIA